MEDITKQLDKVRNKISELSVENLSLKNSNEETKVKYEKEIDNIFCEFLNVIDTFDKSEQVIKEKGLDADENAQKAIKRLLNAKKKAVFALEKFGVQPIVFENNMVVDEWCVTNGTEPDVSKRDGEIITIEKQGYMRKERLLRPAEVIIVKN